MKTGWIVIAAAALPIGFACCAPGDGSGTPSPAAQAQPMQQEGQPLSPRGGDAAHYRLNPAQSQLTAHVGVGGLLAAAGHPHTISMREFGGDVLFDEGHLDSTSLDLIIKAASLREAGEGFSDKQRERVNHDLQEQALESGRYPDIVFRGQAASVRRIGQGRYEASIQGDLTLHGATHRISFPAMIRLEGDHLRATGGFQILHSQYGIKRLSAVGGAVKASDEIRLEFDLRADKGA
jgi:polyisoprenoid-binding protein YceI